MHTDFYIYGWRIPPIRCNQLFQQQKGWSVVSELFCRLFCYPPFSNPIFPFFISISPLCSVLYGLPYYNTTQNYWQSLDCIVLKLVWGVSRDGDTITSVVPKIGSKSQTSVFKVKLAALTVFRKPHPWICPSFRRLAITKAPYYFFLLHYV